MNGRDCLKEEGLEEGKGTALELLSFFWKFISVLRDIIYS